MVLLDGFTFTPGLSSFWPDFTGIEQYANGRKESRLRETIIAAGIIASSQLVLVIPRLG